MGEALPQEHLRNAHCSGVSATEGGHRQPPWVAQRGLWYQFPRWHQERGSGEISQGESLTQGVGDGRASNGNGGGVEEGSLGGFPATASSGWKARRQRGWCIKSLGCGTQHCPGHLPPSGYGWSTPHPESRRACLSHSPLNERKRTHRCECLPAEQKPGSHGNEAALVTSLGLSVHNHQASPYRWRHGGPRLSSGMKGPRLSPSCKKG